ncbi:MAG: hypothetical protein E4G89_00330 [Methanothrix sp.]|nr:MAG: hypothetical protein E4G89_00330 [Methanothrix sp.]
MDKKSQKLMLEAENVISVAEQTKPIAGALTLSQAITQAFQASRMIKQLTRLRTERNEAAQKKVRETTAIYKPMIDSLEELNEKLRLDILTYLNPTGDLGNQIPEEVRSYGANGIGTASFAETSTFDCDLAVLMEQHPELLVADEKAIAKLIKAGTVPKGVTVKTSYVLRVT